MAPAFSVLPWAGYILPPHNLLPNTPLDNSLQALKELRKDYKKKETLIRERLGEFRLVRESRDDGWVFKELCFCILAANSSAVMGMRSVAAIEDILMEGSLEELQSRLSRGFRYWRIRPAYIVHTREYLKSRFGFKILKRLQEFPRPELCRDSLAGDPDIKGIGMKESSHFLRNIGFGGCAILDKHILRSLAELKVIRLPKKPLDGKRYRKIEKRMQAFSVEAGIGMDELDLLLWSRKTGEILK